MKRRNAISKVSMMKKIQKKKWKNVAKIETSFETFILKNWSDRERSIWEMIGFVETFLIFEFDIDCGRIVYWFLTSGLDMGNFWWR